MKHRHGTYVTNSGTILQKLQDRHIRDPLSPMAYAVAQGLLVIVGNNNPHVAQALQDARYEIRSRFAAQHNLPRDFIAENQADEGKYLDQAIAFKVGCQVAAEILGVQ